MKKDIINILLICISVLIVGYFFTWLYAIVFNGNFALKYPNTRTVKVDRILGAIFFNSILMTSLIYIVITRTEKK